eukprot:gene12909-9572_t
MAPTFAASGGTTFLSAPSEVSVKLQGSKTHGDGVRYPVVDGKAVPLNPPAAVATPAAARGGWVPLVEHSGYGSDMKA